MLASYHPYWLSWVSLAAFLLSLPTMTAAEPAPPDAGITVEARGPVHEAYAQPVTATPQPGLLVNKQPPDPIPEEPPEQKPALDNVIWIPGYWAWDTDRTDFLWVSGFWRVPPEGRRWVPGYWNKVDDGWQWVSGFWVPTTQAEVTYVPEPPASVDNGPSVPAPDDSSTWVPGNWVWRTSRFVWRPGFWFGSQEGQVWTPATYYSDALRLRLRGRLPGLSPGGPRPPLRAGLVHATALDEPGLVVHPELLRGRAGFAVLVLGTAIVWPLLLRRLLRGRLCASGFLALDIVRPALSRPALRLLPLAQRPRLLPEPERDLRRSEQRRSGAPGADAGGAQPSDREAQRQLQATSTRSPFAIRTRCGR